MAGVRDYSTTAASNLTVGGIGIQEGMARSSVNNAMRATLADTANLLLDLGGAVTTSGTGTTYALSLPSAPSAYADNLAFVCKLHHAVSGAATININGLGVKPFKKLVNGTATDFHAGDLPAGHRADCIYSSADTAVLVLNAAVTFGMQFVDDLDEMLGLPSPSVGTTIFVGPEKDQFLVVDDATLGSDGGTVFIPDSELSALTSETIPPGTFAGATGALVAMEYSLAHTGIAFETVELVLTDGGETIDIWGLHGHVMQPITTERANCPQLPLIDTANGKFRDPYAGFTGAKSVDHPPLRTGGALLRYKYATSGLRLKRITGPVFQLRWWPAIAVEDEAPATQTDNTGKICWCANAAALAKAEAVYVDKMYYYARTVEWPEGVELRGKGPGLSGFRVMDDMQHTQLLLSSSSAPDPTVNPLTKPATRLWSYDSTFLSNSTTFLPASGAGRIRISGIEFDGNVENNMRIFTQQNAEYAYTYSAANITLFNNVTSAAFAVTNQSNRVIPEGMILELHNVKMHGYAHLLLGNNYCRVVQTGLLELGNTPTGHWIYLADGIYETVRCFGYCLADGVRARYFVAKSLEFILAPHPDVMFTLADNYAVRTMILLSSTEFMPQEQRAALGFPYPVLSPTRISVDHLFIDATGLDEWPGGAAAYEHAIPFLLSSDNFHIRSGKVRLGRLMTAVSSIITTQANNGTGQPYRNLSLENLNIEYSSRVGIQLQTAGSADGGWANANFRNITFEPRAATHLPGNPSPGGVSVLLGAWRFHETVLAEPVPPTYAVAYDGRIFDFTAAGSLTAGSYIDITPPDPAALVFRIWFQIGGSGSAPAAGGTTVIQATAASATPAVLAAAFSAAITGNATCASYLTAATFNTLSVVGSFSYYRHNDKGGHVGGSVVGATGVTTVLRAYRRNYEPSIIGFERIVATDPIYQSLINLNEVGPHRDINFTFKDCVLGSYSATCILLNGGGGLNVSAVNTIKDQVHWAFEDCLLDWRDGTTWQTLDLTIYAGKFRNCRFRTPAVGTGVPALGTGYETLYSEQGGIETWTPSGAETTHDIQTKLFNIAKDGNVRLYPANAATAALWNTIYPEWRKSARPVGGASTALGGGGAFYQGLGSPGAINEDRRAPALRLNFSSAPAAVPLSVGWSAAVSP